MAQFWQLALSRCKLLLHFPKVPLLLEMLCACKLVLRSKLENCSYLECPWEENKDILKLWSKKVLTKNSSDEGKQTVQTGYLAMIRN